MARESKRKRFDRRFGKAERLADRFIAGESVAIPAEWCEFANRTKQETYSDLRIIFERATAIDASNIAEYVGSGGVREDGVLSGLPTGMPPFPETAIEYQQSPGGRLVVSLNWFMDSENGEFGPDQLHDVVEAIGPQSSVASVVFISDKHNGIDYVVGPVAFYQYGMDADWKIMPKVAFESFLPSVDRKGIQGVAVEACVVSATTYSLMACKNIKTEIESPRTEIDRLRKKAGLKPFLRYRTIIIEPFKELVNHNGGIESTGIKRALQLVRGHFATLTKNNKGEPLEKHTRYFRQPHVRGNAKNGVIVSDYSVKAPRTPTQ